MSSEILYQKQFIKVDNDRVIPMIEQGSSNCYEATGNGRKRARDWGNSSFGHGIIVKNSDLLEYIDKMREDAMETSKNYVEKYDESWAYDDKRFGYHTAIKLYGKSTSGTSFNAFKSFYNTGIKQAMTIEDLLNYGISFTIHVYRWDDKDITGKGFEIKPDVTFKSTQHMIDTINEFESYYGDKFSVYVRMGGEWNLEYIKRERQVVKPKREKVKKDVDNVWVLDCAKGYFVKQLKNGYKYSYYFSYQTKKFETKEQADKFHTKMKNKESFTVRNFKVNTSILV